MPDVTISSIQDLLGILGSGTYSGTNWFRGQANQEWKLIPGYYRINTPPSEMTLLSRFKQNAAMLLNGNPRESFDWLFIMQHYGVPTRLLDWSESPLVALYFAVEDQNYIAVDGALWMLQPTELNKFAKIVNKDEEYFIPSFDHEELQNYTIEALDRNKRTNMLPLATIATRNNPRIQAQYGVFTIHEHDKVAIESIGDMHHVAKYVVPAGAKKSILSQLSMLGITRFQLFPELASIGELMKEIAK